MTERSLPAPYVWEATLAPQAEGPVYRVRDCSVGDRPARMVTASAHTDAAWSLRQAHGFHERLAHPHLAAAYASGRLPDGGWFAVHEGLTPAAGLDADGLWACLPGWLAALAHLHRQGWVHGAIGPETLGLGEGGVAKLQSPGQRWRGGQPGPNAAATALAAPEMLAGARLDGRTDLYLLGAACLQLLAGREPAAGWDDLGLAPGWEAFLNGVLAPVPARRFAGAEAAIAGLAGGHALASAGASSPLVTPFVGRRRELERLLSLADEVGDGGSFRVVAIAGEAGVGVSRLMEEFRSRLRFRGFAVLGASAGALVDARPLAAWIPLVGTLFARACPALAGELAPVLAGVIAGAGVSPAPALEPRAERMRLFRSIATLVEEAARPDGLGLFIDDWHLADTASRDLVAYLQQALPAVPLCLVLGGHEPPPAGTDGLTLERFDAGEVEAVCRGVWRDNGPLPGPAGDDGGWLVALAGDTGGHPALVEAIACSVQQLGGPGGLAAARASFRAAPRGVAGLQAIKLTGRTAQALVLASAVAIAGPDAPLPLLQGIAELEDEPFLQAIDELVEAGALAPASASGYRLTLPAQGVLGAAPPGWAPQAHERALGYWRFAAQMGQAVPASRLAHHALEADGSESAAYYAVRAAREALRIFALAEAGELLDRGEAALQTLAAVPADWRLDYATARGDHRRFSGQGLEAEALYREAVALATNHDPGRLGELGVSLGIALNLQARSSEAEACYRSALAAAAAETPLFARATNALARLCVRLGRPDEAETCCRTVLASPHVPSLYRGEALGLLGLVLTTVQPQRADEGLGYLAEAMALAEATGDRLAMNNACMLTGNARMALGQLGPARTSFERYALLCQELGLADEAACATLNLAQVAFEEGQFQEAFRRARLGTAAAAGAGNRIYEAFGNGYIALAGCHLGHLADAERALEDGLAIAGALGNDYMALQLLVVQLEAQIFLGRLGRAEELGLAFERRQRASGIQDFAGPHALLMGQLYQLSGEVGAAVQHLQQARSLGLLSGRATLVGNAELELALVALQAGQLALAGDRARQALAWGERAGAALPCLRAHLLLAGVNGLLGDDGQARASLAAAQALAEDLGSPHWQALVWHGAARLGGGAANEQKASAFLHFYLQQLPPRARQEFLNWPERRDALRSRVTGPLEGPVFEGTGPSALEKPAPMVPRSPRASQGACGGAV